MYFHMYLYLYFIHSGTLFLRSSYHYLLKNIAHVMSICNFDQCCIYHTFNLSFLLHGQDFRKSNFTPKKTTKDTKNTKNFSEKVKCMQFFHPIWKNLHLTENFYTGTAGGAGDKYEVWCENVKV